jgi:hypothetical protein
MFFLKIADGEKLEFRNRYLKIHQKKDQQKKQKPVMS